MEKVDPKIIERRWEKKKEDIHELANDINRLRAHLSKDFKSDDEKDFLTSLAILTMLRTTERVGNQDSADNGHFGVTGFKKKHIKIDGNKVIIEYTGKTGVKQKKEFTDERIANGLRRAIKNSPSSYVFETSDGFNIKNDRINRYLDDFGVSAKSLRGYSANKIIIGILNRYDIPKEEKQRKKLYNLAAKSTAEQLGHGASTLKTHYIVPELPIYYIEKGKIVDLKNLGYYKLGGEIIKKNERVQEKKEEGIIESLSKTFTFKQLFQ